MKPTRGQAEAVYRGTIEAFAARTGKVQFPDLVLTDDELGLAIQTLRAAPAGVDPRLWAGAFVAVLTENPRMTWRRLQAAPRPELIRATTKRLTDRRGPFQMFLRAAIDDRLDDAALQRAWTEAVTAMHQLDHTAAWGGARTRERTLALAKQPVIVGAIQATAVGCEYIGLTYLAVLAAEGSEASMDALLVRIDRAGDEGVGSLEVLGRLRTHAKRTPWMDAMLDTIDRRVAERKRASKAIGFARDIGLGDLKSFWLEQWVTSTARTERGEGRYWIMIMVFCTEVAWFHVSLNETAMGGGPTLRQSNYDDDDTKRDDFGLGALKPKALPQWLQRAGKQLGTQWQFGTFRTSLRGKKRAQLSAWLRGSE